MNAAQFRLEWKELRRIMTSTNDPDRLLKVISSAGFLVAQAPAEFVVSAQALLIEADRRHEYALFGRSMSEEVPRS